VCVCVCVYACVFACVYNIDIGAVVRCLGGVLCCPLTYMCVIYIYVYVYICVYIYVYIYIKYIL